MLVFQLFQLCCEE